MTIYNTLYIAIYFIAFTCIDIVQCQLGHRRNENSIDSGSESANLDNTYGGNKGNGNLKKKQDCWMKFNTAQLFDTMDRLDKSYIKARTKIQQAIKYEELDSKMLDAMLKSKAIADRAVQLAGDPSYIPAGLNLGGYCMMRMADSVLFFHRMKLRNDTSFRVNSLKNDLDNMVLTARLSLNDLHLVGTYERSITDKDPSVLYYTPTFGQVEFLLKDVSYKMEGRYRLLKDKLYLEMVISEVQVNGGILMIYSNHTSHSKAISLVEKNIEDFLERVKSDLDDWLLDYFNDYLILFDVRGIENNAIFQQYDKKKTLALNDYFDEALTVMRERLQKLNASSVKLPNFSIHSVPSLKMKLTDGLLYGLDSIYRRSLATGAKKGNIRKADAIVGFSSLKVVYKYEAVLTPGTPVLTGFLVLSADELTAHLGLSLVKKPEAVDLTFDHIRQMKPESLTVEGSANKMIANFKHLLELHIIAIMTNTLLYQIKLLTTLTRCTPDLVGYVDPNDLPYQKQMENYQSDAKGLHMNARPQNSTNDDLDDDTENNNEEESVNNFEANQNNDEIVENTDNNEGSINSDLDDNTENNNEEESVNNSEANQNNAEIVENTNNDDRSINSDLDDNTENNNEEESVNNSEANQNNEEIVENTDNNEGSINSDLDDNTENNNEEESVNNSKANQNNEEIVENTNNDDSSINSNLDDNTENNNEEESVNDSEANQNNEDIVENTDNDESSNTDEKNNQSAAGSHSENHISAPDYVFGQEETFELQVPANASIPKKMFLKYNEKFTITND